MDEEVIDTLKIKVTGDTADAEKSLEKLLSTLTKLNGISKRMQSASPALDAVAESLRGIDSGSVAKLRNLADGLQKLSGVKISKTIAARISDIGASLGALTKGGVRRLNELADAAERLAAAKGISGIVKAASESSAKTAAAETAAAAGSSILSDAAAEKARGISESVSNANGQMNASVQILKDMGSAGKRSFASIISGAGKAGRALLKSAGEWRRKLTKKLFSHIGHRFLDSILTTINNSWRDGIAAVYKYSKAYGGEFNRSLDNIVTDLQYIKASLGALAAPVLNMLAPVIDFLTDKFVGLTNSITLMFASLSGSGTWTRAVKSATKFSDSAADAANAVKQLSAGFDELNVLSESRGKNGGYDWTDHGFDFTEEILDAHTADAAVARLTTISLLVGEIAFGITAWKFKDKIAEVFEFDKALTAKRILGITIAVTGFTLEAGGAYSLGHEGASLAGILKSAIGAALGVGGSLLVFGTGPVGWTVGIGLALTVFLTGFTLGRDKAAFENELKERFGDIALSDKELEIIAKGLTTSELSLRLKPFIDEKTAVDEISESLDHMKSKLDRYDLRIKFGLDVERSDYKAAVDDYLSKLGEYISNRRTVSFSAIDLLFGGTDTGARLTDSITGFYDSKQAELESLGLQLKDKIAKGFSKGKWIPDVHAEIVELRRQIEEVKRAVAAEESEAALVNLKLKYKDVPMTAENVKTLTDDIKKITDAQIAQLDEVRLEGIKVALGEKAFNIENGMSESAANALFDKTLGEVQLAYDSRVAELTSGGFDFGLSKIGAAYVSESEKVISAVGDITKGKAIDRFGNWFSVIGTDPLVTTAISDSTADIGALINDCAAESLMYVFSSIDRTTHAGVAEMVEGLKPTAEQLETIAANARALGQSVPDGIAEQLNSYHAVNAVTGSTQSLLYLMGQLITEDENFLIFLNTCKESGTKLPASFAEGIMNNSDAVIDPITGLVTDVSRSLSEKLEAERPIVAAAAVNLGAAISGNLITSTSLGVIESDYGEVFGRIPASMESPLALVKQQLAGLSADYTGALSDMDTGTGPVIENITSKFGKLKRSISDAAKEIADSINDMFDSVGTELTGPVKRNGSAINLPRVSGYASGGFPEPGELFIAREAGAELVGSLGGRAAVASNDQIVEGIREGVYEAITEAGGGDTDVRVYLDSRQIAAEVEKRRAERGADIYGNGVKQT